MAIQILGTVALPLVCGIVIWITSRGTSRSMAKDLATHLDRPNRSRWLDPVLSEKQLVVVFRLISVLALAFAVFGMMKMLIG